MKKTNAREYWNQVEIVAEEFLDLISNGSLTNGKDAARWLRESAENRHWVKAGFHKDVADHLIHNEGIDPSDPDTWSTDSR